MHSQKFEVLLAADAALSRLSFVSEKAFSKPPWKLTGSHVGRLTKYLALPSADLFIALGEDRELLGFSIGVPIGDDCFEIIGKPAKKFLLAGDYFHLWRAVLPEHTGLGVGSALAKVRTERAKSVSAPRTTACTDIRNSGTILMYRSMGFAELGRAYYASDSGLTEHVFLGLVL